MNTENPNGPIRMWIALKLLRAWNTKDQFDSSVVVTVYDWLDGGMVGPIPWPSSPFFAEWASSNGFSNVDGFIGFRFHAVIGKGGAW